jgi:HD superfamily phosphohydrolase
MDITPTAPFHEEWTAALISSPESDIHTALTQGKMNPSLIASCFGGKPQLPMYLKQLVSSQLDVDRMDYLCRDSHYAGVAVGRVDIQYLIQSLAFTGKGKRGSTLGIGPKGIKAYEGFIVARHLMNRTVYYHPRVKVFEYMMEQFIREAIAKADDWRANPALASSVPEYLIAMAAAVGADPPPDKQEFVQQHWKTYRDLTEDSIWHLATRVANLAPTGLPRQLAELLLSRKSLAYRSVQAEKANQLSEALKDAGFELNRDYGLVRVASTPYKRSKEAVFVVEPGVALTSVLKLSDLLSLLRDREEEDAFLVFVDEEKRADIEKVAQEEGVLLYRKEVGSVV